MTKQTGLYCHQVLSCSPWTMQTHPPWSAVRQADDLKIRKINVTTIEAHVTNNVNIHDSNTKITGIKNYVDIYRWHPYQ